MDSLFLGRLQQLKGGETDAEFARRCGVGYTTMKRYLEGSTPGLDNAAAIAEANSVTLDWLYGRDNVPAVRSDSVILPRFDVRASAGAGALVAAEEVSEYFAVGREWLRRNLPAWAPLDAVVGALENGGDSMEPTVRDGDLLMVVQVTDWRVVERGGIFVFTHHDRLHLKRLQVMMNGDLKIISDNKAYEPWLVPFDDIQHSVRLLGQVFFAGGKPRSY